MIDLWTYVSAWLYVGGWGMCCWYIEECDDLDKDADTGRIIAVFWPILVTITTAAWTLGFIVGLIGRLFKKHD